MANTIIELNDTPSSYSLSANKFLRVNSDGNAVQFWDIKLDYLEDVEASNAYAPSVGQSLVYTADGKWRPSTLDIYSAGNGLNKSALTLNVTAGAGGGLVSNTSGVFISDIANVSGTYGNATHVPAVTVNSKGQVTSVTPTLITASQATTITNSFVGNVVGTSGQISVTGGTGNNSNATLNLVATGVTAATYGNATTIPQITVDTYGRIQNIDLIALVGGGSGSSGNVNTAFKHIAVSGQTNISADRSEDTLTLVGAGGISLTTDAGTDTLTITGNSSAIVGASGINTLSDIDTTGVTNGQALVYNSSTSKFEAGTPVATLANSGVTAGTYGSSTSSARIVVDAKGIITGVSEQAIPQGDITEVIAGSGLNGGGTTGSVTLNMENTGVTAKTYGNSTYTPVITVNSRGQITNISNIATSGGGGGGSAQSLTWNAGTYSLGISSGNNVDLSTLNNVVNDTTPQLGGSLDVNGQSIVSVSNGNIPITPNGSGKIILDGLSWPTADGTANYVLQTDGAGQLSWVAQTGSYDNTSVDTHLNVSGASASQVLSWNGSDYAWVAQTDTDAQDLTISGNVISLTGQSGNVDLTSALASVTSSYGDSNVSAYLSAQGYATQSTIVAAITDSAPGTLDTLNELAAALGDDPNFATTITNSIATKANTSSLANVATSGLYTDLTSRPTISLSGSDLTYDGTTLDLTGVGAVGPQGDTGAAGSDGVSVTNATLNTNNLILTLSNASTINAGNVRGPVGPQGVAGGTFVGARARPTANLSVTSDFRSIPLTDVDYDTDSLVSGNAFVIPANSSISYVEITAQVDARSGGPNLIRVLKNNVDLYIHHISSNDGGGQDLPLNTGVIPATAGDSFEIQIKNSSGGSGGFVNYQYTHLGIHATVTGTTAQGPAGNDGTDGVSITNTTLVGSNLVITLSNSSTIDAGNVRGPVGPTGPAGADGAVDQTLSISGNVITISGNNDTVDLTTMLSPYLKAETDSQDLSLSGNVISLTGQSGNVDLTSLLVSNIYTNSDVDTHLNTSGASSGQVLTWNGSDYSWTAKTVDTDTDAQALSLSGNVISLTGQSGNVDLTSLLAGAGGGSGDITSVVAGTGLSGGATTGDATLNLADTAVTAGTYGNATTVGAFTVDAQGRITGVSNVAISGGGGATTLDGLTDVSASSPSSGQVLKWNGSAWAPAADLNSGGGGSGATIQRFKLNYNSSGQLDSTSNLTSLVNSVSIDSASGGDVTVNFDSSITMPPASVMMYGYDYTNNKYSMVPAETTMALREIAGGGSSGSPTLFDGGSTIALKLRLRETETGASRTFGSVTHAWIQFVIYD